LVVLLGACAGGSDFAALLATFTPQASAEMALAAATDLPAPSETATPSVLPSETTTPAPSETPSATATASPSATWTPTFTNTPTPSKTPTPSRTPTSTPRLPALNRTALPALGEPLAPPNAYRIQEVGSQARPIHQMVRSATGDG
jgi:hypothetical protein